MCEHCFTSCRGSISGCFAIGFLCIIEVSIQVQSHDSSIACVAVENSSVSTGNRKSEVI